MVNKNMTDNVELLRLAATFPCDPRHKQLLLESADQIERLRTAIGAAIKEAKQPHYGDKYIQLDNYDDAILILEKVLEGK
jgi:hypothetical protein